MFTSIKYINNFLEKNFLENDKNASGKDLNNIEFDRKCLKLKWISRLSDLTSYYNNEHLRSKMC